MAILCLLVAALAVSVSAAEIIDSGTCGDNLTWTDDVMLDYGGDITWVAYTPVVISEQPKTAYAKSGETAKVTVKAEGDGLKYQWYYKNAGALNIPSPLSQLLLTAPQ